jgi:hypothetical protein
VRNTLKCSSTAHHAHPSGWEGFPQEGDEVEVVAPPNKRRGQIWRVVEIRVGRPGRPFTSSTMVLEPVKVKRDR